MPTEWFRWITKRDLKPQFEGSLVPFNAGLILGSKRALARLIF